jgi:LPS-assembly protein
MRSRTFIFITLLALCPCFIRAQALTNELPPPAQKTDATPVNPQNENGPKGLPDDPGQEIPIAQPEPAPEIGEPISWETEPGGHQTWVGDTMTLSGGVVVHYRDYVLRADEVTYDRSTSELEADGNLELTGGPDDIIIHAAHGDMRLNIHTARFFAVHGTMGVRRAGRTTVFTTTNPFVFSGRVLLQNGEGNYKIVDGTMTNCRLPRPDWLIISRSIDLVNGAASTRNAAFKFLNVPLFYLPYLRHPINETGRESGLLIPVFPTNYSSIRGYTLGEQVYVVLGRSMDMVVGSDYYSKRGWAPNGDFRYKGPGLDHLTARWNALLDRGVDETTATTAGGTTTTLVNQGGLDISALGRKDFSPEIRLAGNVEYLSSYVYRLVFNDNYTQAISSEVSSDLALTRVHKGYIPSIALDRFQGFASSTEGDEVRILHLPSLRFDILDRPLGGSGLYGGLGSSLSYLSRSEPDFHARNVGRIDIYPRILLPLHAGGWNVVPEAALRMTAYSISQTPNLTAGGAGIPTISHDPLHRDDLEASVDIRPPALERDFALGRWNRELRHVIEPEITYRYVSGIGRQARNVLRFDTTDTASDTNEVGISVTQRFYMKSNGQQPCVPDAGAASAQCPVPPREWASWQIAERYYIDPDFGGAIIAGRRNVFDTTLDLSGVAFLTGNRDLSPVTSRIRFEAIDNLRIQWDLDYDPKTGRLSSDNLYAGYSWDRTTVGVGHALLNAVDETSGSASTIQSKQVQPFFTIGSPTGTGFNLAANGGYDFIQNSFQYWGVQAVYNWNCCGLTFGYRRFELGTVGTTSRNEPQYLFSFTLANFGSVGDIRRANSVFRDPNLPPAY